MNYVEITQNDYEIFHKLANAYYREGEDENTAQEEVDAFIQFLFEKVIKQEINGCFAKSENTYIGFALWVIDTEDFEFSEIQGFGTIMEIGLIPSYRASGYGKEFVMFIEDSLRIKEVNQCYVSAYGPAQKFWESCGYVESGKTASNGLPIMIKNMITIQEIPVENANEFWDAHIKYLLEDEIISDEEDIEYFSGDEYRTVIIDHMERPTDKHHMVYFVRGGKRIGAAQYNTYQSEDGKCFMLDFWVFPEYRGNGTGHACFEALENYTRADGAVYYELNSEKENSIRFWKSLGFVEAGVDEWDMKVFVRK